MYSTFETTDAPSWFGERQAELANLCHLFATAYDLPAKMEGDEADCLRRVGADLPEPLATSAAATADAWQSALRDRQLLELAYARLFLGPFEILAPPYASFYLEADRRIFGDVSQFVASAYAQAGLAPATGPREAPDHIVCELEFAYFLAFQSENTEQPVWQARQRNFWGHLLQWLPDFCNAVHAAEAHPFYNQASRLLAQIVCSVQARA